MDKLKMSTPDLTDKNIEQIGALFPNVITETRDENGAVKKAVDFDLLKQALSKNLVEDDNERYRLDWPGKKASLLKANTPIHKTLRPCREESVNFDTTENLYIEGDNFEVLKILQESYLGKIKMIYIDPPYNTGNDFIYKDKFAKSKDEYEEELGTTDEEGGKLFRNTDSNGRYHSDWLSMMYERLVVARDLLKDDGVIFISIDDNEVHNLRKICDEVFGEENFVECITWNKRIPKNDKGIGNIHEYVLIYAKDSSNELVFTMRKDGLDDIYELTDKLKKNNTSLSDAEVEIKKLYKKNGYDRGITLYNSFDKNYRLWGKINMSWPNANTFGPTYTVTHPITKKPVKIPDRGWRWKEETFQEAAVFTNGIYQDIQQLHDGSYLCGKIWFAKDENTQPSSVTYLDDVNTFLLRSILSFKSDGGIEVENIFEGKSYFSYPKPTQLLTILISALATNPSDIILDFFSGSATTAHAVMQLNAEELQVTSSKLQVSSSKLGDDSSKLGVTSYEREVGRRKFIMVQLPEPCDPNSEAFKAGYKTIAEIGKERIRRAGKKIVNSYKLEVTREEKEEMIKYGCIKLSESDRMAESNGLNSGSLSTGKETAERGNLFSFGSDEESGGVDSVEHSGGKRTADSEGVSAIPSYRQGVSSRTGDTTSNMHKGQLPCPYGYKSGNTAIDRDKQDDHCPHENTLNCPLVTCNSKLKTPLDIGFRVYKTDSTNMKDVFYHPSELKQDQLSFLESNIKDDRTPEDLLTQVILDLGLELTLPIETKVLKGSSKKKSNTVFIVQTNALVACFDNDIDFKNGTERNRSIVDEIADLRPMKVVFKDASFRDDKDRINVEERFKRLSPETKVTVI